MVHRVVCVMCAMRVVLVVLVDGSRDLAQEIRGNGRRVKREERQWGVGMY